ncbi:hypothetical protein [Halobacillus sp. BBL2006]|uniref:hypothetical protein n=1 Tax=Halobacillus sp. BBL2006 TaxID=1543706 RepID=UPI000542A740|nr:hypothetical protein [Halobacillus sp. BBL2006]KHE69938.1 hypothetical protein LD39_12180 [Halobacillus sp. BBL2006]
MDWIPYIVVPLVVGTVVMIKIKDVRKKRNNPPRKWEGEPASANEQRWHDAEKEGARRAVSGGGDM